MRKYLTPSEALKELNQLKTIKANTKDGHISARKVSKTSYEIKVFVGDEQEPQKLKGTIKNVLKAFNDPKINDGFFIEE